MVRGASGERCGFVALGADQATILGAVTPVPDTLSEYAFAGLLRGTKTEVVKCVSNDLEIAMARRYAGGCHLSRTNGAEGHRGGSTPVTTMK